MGFYGGFVWELVGVYDDLLSGKQPHSYGKPTMFHGKTDIT